VFFNNLFLKALAAFGEGEKIYQHLWKNYFKSVNIISRKNTKLHIKHIPKRYWKHLAKKSGIICSA